MDPGLDPLTLADIYILIFQISFASIKSQTHTGTYRLYKSYTVVSEILIGIIHLKKKVVTKTLTWYGHSNAAVDDRQRLVHLTRNYPNKQLWLLIQLALIRQALITDLVQRLRPNPKAKWTLISLHQTNVSVGSYAPFS